LGVWLGFTDTKIGRAGQWIGFENYIFLMSDSVTQLALFNTMFYTTVASVLKFFLGLWLALLLNRNLRFKSFFRAVILLPTLCQRHSQPLHSGGFSILSFPSSAGRWSKWAGSMPTLTF
jgi:ABC-type sugar transport system permease subunit